MEILDQAYLNDLVRRAGRGSSDAFAELFSATYRQQYAYLYFMLGEKTAAEEALREVYARALRKLPSLTRAGLFLPWIGRTACLVCGEFAGGEAGGAAEEPFGLSRLISLPLTESQILIMKCRQHLSDNAVGTTLNLSRPLLRRHVRDGLRRLQRGAENRGAGAEGAALHARGHISAPKLPAARAAQILEKVFADSGREPNRVPLEALASYAVYRRERFSLQRGILTAGLVCFLLLPLLFILPKFRVTASEAGERKLPVYTIEVRAGLPVHRVTAKIRTRSLPVYEADAGLYTVEPTRNGEMTVYVELLNRQGIRKTVQVNDVDAEGPVLADSRIGEETFELLVSDAGIGVDYRGIYAVGRSGERYYPLETDEAAGSVLFAYPDENWDVYIPDHIGNTLHLALTLE